MAHRKPTMQNDNESKTVDALIKVLTSDDCPLLDRLAPFFIQKFSPVSQAAVTNPDYLINSNIRTGASARNQKSWHFWLQTVAGIDETVHAWNVFTRPNVIENHFRTIEPRLAYLTRTPQFADAQVPAEVHSIRLLGQYFYARYLAIEYEWWCSKDAQKNKRHATIKDFLLEEIFTIECIEKDSLVGQLEKMVHRGNRLRRLEDKVGEPAISVFTALKYRMFDRSVPKEAMPSSVAIEQWF